MDIKRLKPGEIAPQDADCINITKAGEGRFMLLASALQQCDEEDASSESVVRSDAYDSYEKAEQAGLAWAEGHCVKQVYVESA